MKNDRDLLFLGGFGAPVFLFTPWFFLFRRRGWRAHVVPNSPMAVDPVTTFSDALISLSEQYDCFDVLGVSYGGNAALYAASQNSAFSAKVRRMILVCAPLLGTPTFVSTINQKLPGWLPKAVGEMAKDGEVAESIREFGTRGEIPFDLHCLYHERDLMAPREAATLPGVSTDHRLEFEWKFVPGITMHQAASVNPKTLTAIMKILTQ